MVGADYIPALFPFDLATSEGEMLQELIHLAMDGNKSGSVSLGLCSTTNGFGTAKDFEIVGCKEVLKKLNEIVFELVLRSGRPFTWTSLQAHLNVASSRHVDAGLSLALLAVTGRSRVAS